MTIPRLLATTAVVITIVVLWIWWLTAVLGCEPDAPAICTFFAQP